MATYISKDKEEEKHEEISFGTEAYVQTRMRVLPPLYLAYEQFLISIKQYLPLHRFIFIIRCDYFKKIRGVVCAF